MTDEQRDPDDPDRTDQWDRYWAHGFLTSCADAFDGNYQGAVAERWREFFRDLDNGARILDVCTGNGAIAALAAEQALAQARDWSIDAIDLARIRPARALKDRPQIADRVRFHARVPADNTPFADARFDAVVGQYALEYTPVESTISELARVCAPSGRAMFVIHHTDSVVIRTAREELRNGRLLFEETALFDHARAFLDCVGQVPPGDARRALSGDPVSEKLRIALNSAAGSVSVAAAGSHHPELLLNALGTVSEAWKTLDSAGRQTALARIDAGRDELEANLERLRDLTRAAVDPERARSIADLFLHAGFERTRLETLHHDGARLMGWVLTATRAPSRL